MVGTRSGLVLNLESGEKEEHFVYEKNNYISVSILSSPLYLDGPACVLDSVLAGYYKAIHSLGLHNQCGFILFRAT